MWLRPLDKLAPLHWDSFSNVPYIYVFITIYTGIISLDAEFDEDSDFELKLELGAHPELVFEWKQPFGAQGVLPHCENAQKSTSEGTYGIKISSPDDVWLHGGTHKDVLCATSTSFVDSGAVCGQGCTPFLQFAGNERFVTLLWLSHVDLASRSLKDIVTTNDSEGQLSHT